MIALLAKELRQLAPIAWLWLAILAFGYATRFFTERIDEQTFSGWCEGYCDPGTGALIAAVLILLTTVTAYSLFPREHDDSTIDFLRALPLSRGRIFVAKVLAGWLLLCGVNVLSYGIDAVLLASNPESLGGRFLGQVWWTLLWRDCAFAFVILSHGVLLSWFRTTGLVVYALYVLLLMWYESTQGSAGCAERVRHARQRLRGTASRGEHALDRPARRHRVRAAVRRAASVEPDRVGRGGR